MRFAPCLLLLSCFLIGPGQGRGLKANEPAAATNVAPAKSSETGPMFVAVGYALRRLTSPDGLTWHHEQAAPEHDQEKNFLLRGVAYGQGRIVAVGGSRTSRILVSESRGREWKDVSVEHNFLGDVAHGNGRFVAVGYQRAITSTDGYSWAKPTRLGEVSWRRIAFGNGLFVAIGASGSSNAPVGAIGVSPDGLAWQQLTIPDGLVPHAIEFGRDRFVLVGAHGLRQSSRDGVHWEPIVRGEQHETLLDLIWTGSEFIATGGRLAYSSPDGVTWSRREFRSPSRTAFGAGRFVGCSAGVFSQSTDGLRWTTVPTEHKLSITKIIFVP